MTEFEIPTTIHVENITPTPVGPKRQRPALHRNHCVPPLESGAIQMLQIDLKDSLNVEVTKASNTSDGDKESDTSPNEKMERETVYEPESRTEAPFNPAVIPLQFNNAQKVARPRRRNASFNEKIHELLGRLRGSPCEEDSSEHSWDDSSEHPSLNLFVPPANANVQKIEANVNDVQAESELATKCPEEDLTVLCPSLWTAHPREISNTILKTPPIDGFLSSPLPLLPPAQDTKTSISKRLKKLKSTGTLFRDAVKPRQRSLLDLTTAINDEFKTARQQVVELEKDADEMGDALQKSIASAEVVQDEMVKKLTEIASAIQALNAIYKSGENVGQNAVSDQSKKATIDVLCGSIRDRSSDEFRNAETLSTDALYGSIRDRNSDDSKDSETSNTDAASRFIQDPSPERLNKRVHSSIRFDDAIPTETVSLPLDSQLANINKLFDGLVNSPRSQKQVKSRTSIPFLKKGSIRQTLKNKIRSRGKLDIHFVGSDVHAQEDDAKGM